MRHPNPGPGCGTASGDGRRRICHSKPSTPRSRSWRAVRGRSSGKSFDSRWTATRPCEWPTGRPADRPRLFARPSGPVRRSRRRRLARSPGAGAGIEGRHLGPWPLSRPRRASRSGGQRSKASRRESSVAAGSPGWPLVVDMDGDGRAEVAVPDSDIRPRFREYRGVKLLNGATGQVRWVQSLHPTSKANDGLVHLLEAPDLDGDGTHELLAVSTYQGRFPQVADIAGAAKDLRGCPLRQGRATDLGVACGCGSSHHAAHRCAELVGSRAGRMADAGDPDRRQGPWR